MSQAQINLVMWAVIIGVICYAFRIDPISIITDVAHGIQTVHNSHG